MFKEIAITQFKNYRYIKQVFNERVIGICGKNGIGKTNLLDALYYLGFTKSYFSRTDGNLVHYGTEGFRIEAKFDLDHLLAVYRGVAKKEISVNGVAHAKVAAHIGKYPMVFIGPDDTALITEGGEERRRFLDTLISQIDATYLTQLIVYNKVLQQRNSMLKQFAETGKKDYTLLEVMNEQLIAPGNYIYKKRQQICDELIPEVLALYNDIAQNNEILGIVYESPLQEQDFAALLQKRLEKDCMLQRTTQGPHKDDFVFTLGETVFKTSASQGQRKSLLFALKLAEFNLLKKYLNKVPTLLLDDVFEKLDAQRMQQLLQQVCVANKGQVFITDTHQERLTLALQDLDLAFQIIVIKE